jgi:hypothetical protein
VEEEIFWVGMGSEQGWIAGGGLICIACVDRRACSQSQGVYGHARPKWCTKSIGLLSIDPVTTDHASGSAGQGMGAWGWPPGGLLFRSSVLVRGGGDGFRYSHSAGPVADRVIENHGRRWRSARRLRTDQCIGVVISQYVFLTFAIIVVDQLRLQCKDFFFL